MRLPGPLSLPRLNRGQLQALLAGGIVVGVGAVSTLATWNDAEHYGNTFNGKVVFDLQSSIDNGAHWSSHTSALSAGSLPFSGDLDAIEGGETVYAAVMLRLSPDTSWNSQVTLQRGDVSGPAAYYQYRAGVIENGTTCDAAAMSTLDPELVPHDTGLSAPLTDATFPVGHAYQAHDQVTICFAVTRDGDPAAVPNTAGSPAAVAWTFTAVPDTE